MAETPRFDPAQSDRLRHGSYWLQVVPVECIEPAPRNARFMRHEVFKRFVDNVKHDGGLSSVPFCWFVEGRFLMVSGHHRLKAAQDAGLDTIPIMYTDAPLDENQFTAMQLSHNELVGEDDPTVLLSLWQSIDAMWAKEYTGLDSKRLGELAKLSGSSLADAKLAFHTVTLFFLPDERERLLALVDTLKGIAPGDILVASEQAYEPFLKAHRNAKKSFNVHNAAVAFMVLVELAERHVEELRDGWLSPDGDPLHKDRVPLSTLFGTDDLPAADAAKLYAAVQALVALERVPAREKWRALTILAEALPAADAPIPKGAAS